MSRLPVPTLRALLCAVLAAATLVAGVAAPAVSADPPGSGEEASSTTTTTTTSAPPRVPSTTTTTPRPPSTTVPSPPPAPASHTPPPAAPSPIATLVPPRPAPNPVAVALASSGDDPTGRLGLLSVAVEEASASLARATADVEEASVVVRRATAELDEARRDRDVARERAAAATDAAAEAREVAIVAATETLIGARSVPHPSDQVAVYGEIDHEALFDHGLRSAFTPAAAKRAKRLLAAAGAARRSAESAADRLEEVSGRRSAVAAELRAAQRRVEDISAKLFTVTAQRNLVADEVAALMEAAAAGPGATRASALDIPARTLDAYLLAAQRAAVDAPGCAMRWWVVAGIGAVETGHGTYRGSYPSDDGVVRPPIIGPRLDGGAFARIGDTDGGRLDGDTDFDRAVGPMQFIPSTWEFSGRDGDGDGVSDPHNVYDAAYSAALYLCRGARGAAVDTPEGFAAAAWSYNRSRAYGALTWQRATAYSAFAPRVLGGLSDVAAVPPGG